MIARFKAKEVDFATDLQYSYNPKDQDLVAQDSDITAQL